MWPFGKRKRARFVDEEALARILATQTDVVGVVDALDAAGMPPNAALQVEYFLYADLESNGQALARELHTRYSTECRHAADGGPLFCTTGWTIPLVINRHWLATWAADMVHLGFGTIASSTAGVRIPLDPRQRADVEAHASSMP